MALPLKEYFFAASFIHNIEFRYNGNIPNFIHPSTHEREERGVGPGGGGKFINNLYMHI